MNEILEHKRELVQHIQNSFKDLEKGGLPEGTIKDWKSGKVIKRGGKWYPYKEGEKKKIKKEKENKIQIKEIQEFLSIKKQKEDLWDVYLVEEIIDKSSLNNKSKDILKNIASYTGYYEYSVKEGPAYDLELAKKFNKGKKFIEDNKKLLQSLSSLNKIDLYRGKVIKQIPKKGDKIVTDLRSFSEDLEVASNQASDQQDFYEGKPVVIKLPKNKTYSLNIAEISTFVTEKEHLVMNEIFIVKDIKKKDDQIIITIN